MIARLPPEHLQQLLSAAPPAAPAPAATQPQATPPTLPGADRERQQQNGSRGYQQHAAQFGHCESNNNSNNDGYVTHTNVDVDAAAAVAATADNLSAAGANATLSAADQSVAMRSEMRARGK